MRTPSSGKQREEIRFPKALPARPAWLRRRARPGALALVAPEVLLPVPGQALWAAPALRAVSRPPALLACPVRPGSFLPLARPWARRAAPPLSLAPLALVAAPPPSSALRAPARQAS